MTNLFGVSIYTLRLFQFIIYYCYLNIGVQVLHLFMMYVSVIFERSNEPERRLEGLDHYNYLEKQQQILKIMQGFLVATY